MVWITQSTAKPPPIHLQRGATMTTTRGRHSTILVGTTLVDDLMFLG